MYRSDRIRYRDMRAVGECAAALGTDRLARRLISARCQSRPFPFWSVVFLSASHRDAIHATEKTLPILSRTVLLSPTLELPPANRASLSERASTVLKREGHLQISQAVSSSAISLTSHAEQPLAAAFIKHLVLTTRAESYAQACRNLSAHPGWAEDVGQIGCEVFILGGEEDYMVPGADIMKRAEQVPEGRGKGVIMKNVGHWGGLEVPEQVGEELLKFVQGEEGKVAL
ncbi:hypothetical protein QFC22_006325 [Naganishia vaughanmartiniae]|uniref:Uncharacterized protein n=1 Tax=Naganishia vaughanmartiniae TaxID=1424756 RepID=A0ACC2WN63_9TREE|nr:hypothetical protein QFC22_006325 [Naganishia vaughanmartiniae]